MSDKTQKPDPEEKLETPAIEKPRPIQKLKESNQKVATVREAANKKVADAIQRRAEAIEAQKSAVKAAADKATAAADLDIQVAAEAVAELEAKLQAAKDQLKKAKAVKKPTIEAAKKQATEATLSAIQQAAEELTRARKEKSAQIVAAKKERRQSVAEELGERITVEFNEAVDLGVRVGKGVTLGVVRPAQHLGQIAKAGFKEGMESETSFGKRAKEIKKRKGNNKAAP